MVPAGGCSQPKMLIGVVTAPVTLNEVVTALVTFIRWLLTY